MATHPVTGEWMPPGGFPRLPQPDGRELRSSLSTAKLLSVVPSYLGRVREKYDLSVYTAEVKGGEAFFYVLEEILDLRDRRRFGDDAQATQPTTFGTLRRRGEEPLEDSE